MQRDYRGPGPYVPWPRTMASLCLPPSAAALQKTGATNKREGAGEVSEATEGEKAKVHQPWWKRWLGVES